MTEQWKDIKGLEGKYQVSNLGRIKSLARKAMVNGGGYRPIKEIIRKLNPSSSGYLSVYFWADGKQLYKPVHQLVWQAFGSGEQSNKMHIHHIDHNVQNNRIDNLKLISAKDHKREHVNKTKTYSKAFGVSYNKLRCKWIAYTRVNGKQKHLGYFKTEKEAIKAIDTI